MNREDIIQMARKAGIDIDAWEPLYEGDSAGFRVCECTHEELERFAALVASHVLVEPCCGNYAQCQKVCMPRAASAERERILDMCKEGLWDAEGIRYHLDNQSRGQA